VIGLCAGFFPRADAIVMRLMDALLAFPPLVLAIALVAFLGSGATSEGDRAEHRVRGRSWPARCAAPR